jgi:flagellar hook-associated protein FlgK
MPGIGLNTGLKALLAAQAALETTGHNISNSSTPGFSRQRLEVTASRALLQRGVRIGSGVSGNTIVRSSDALLLVRTTKQIATVNRLDAALGGMTEIEALMGEPGNFGLSSGISDFFGSISELSASTEDLVLRTGMVQMATAMTTQFNQLSSTMTTVRRDTANQVEIQAQKVNVITERIVMLNEEIGKTEVSGVPANDLRDKREESLRELSSYVDVQFNEDQNGVMRITTGGRLMVGGNKAFKLESVVGVDGDVEVFMEASDVPVKLKHGKIAGLIEVGDKFIPNLQAKMDRLAKNLIFEMNRLHSTGTPSEGNFTTLTSSYRLEDQDQDGSLSDELISRSGLPFDIQSGELFVNVTHRTSGDLNSTKILFNPNETTVGDFLDELNAIDGVNAALNSFNKIQIFADAGFGFDFAPRLNANPDKYGTLGGDRASLGAGQAGPYSLVDGDTMNLTGPVSSFSVAFNSVEFEEMSQATAEEMAAVLNSNAGMQSNGMRAVVTAGRLYIQTDATGEASTFTLDGGTSLAALSMAPGSTVFGSSTAVDLKIGGAYTGEGNNSYRFVPTSDGVIGTTPDLEVDVYNAGGQLVATLDLGDTYQPGTEIEVAEGITATFGFGSLSASENDSTLVNLIADSDTSDVLAALGINAIFTGTGAADIALRDDLVANPQAISAGFSGASGDNRALLAMMGLQSESISALDNDSIGNFYGDTISGVGFEISQAGSSREIGYFLLQNLETRREETSGVNIDEELVDMVRYEQSFNAASRFIQVLNELSDEILSLI